MEQITFNPSNEPYYSEDFIKGFKCGAERQFEADKEDRPQGVWICHEGGWKGFDYYPTKYECDQCHHYIDVANDKNFCPNCGADMRGADDV